MIKLRVELDRHFKTKTSAVDFAAARGKRLGNRSNLGLQIVIELFKDVPRMPPSLECLEC
jgi:hypothetical protein